MYLLIFLLILLSPITTLIGRRLGSLFVTTFIIFFQVFSIIIGCILFYEVCLMDQTCEIFLFDWVDLFVLYSPFVLYFDKLSTSMLFLVIFISALVHLFATGYMKDDPCILRFFFYLGIFTFFMCLMVVSGTLLQFFFAWEGVGLASYLLINFWYTRAEANRAAMKAMIMNRFGDFGLYFAIILIFTFYKTLHFTTLNAVAHLFKYENLNVWFFGFNLSIHDLICFCLFLAVVGKSAQLGLHTWLPDAMEGPTPVSALLHAATMVTAGVYLLLRLSAFMEEAPNVLLIISFWGALTAFFASSVGAFQNDIKKIIAYSTCSQLGYMVSACGLHNFIGSYFHLFNHAFFKALLFLGAGSVIHSLIDEQDLRKYGSLVKFLPVTYICMMIGSLSLIGFPFTSGYYSKDLIINWAYAEFTWNSHFVYWFLVFSAFFTSYYSTKLINLTFFGSNPRFSLSQLKYIKESNFRIIIPLIILSIFSAVSGYLFYDLFVGYGGDLFYLSVNFSHNQLFEAELLSPIRKFVPFFFVISGSLVYFFCNYLYINYFSNIVAQREMIYKVLPLKNFLSKKWFFDFFYFHIVLSIMNFSYSFLFKTIDKGIIEDLFVKKPIYFFVNISRLLETFRVSDLNFYLLFFINILFSIILLFFFFYFNSGEDLPFLFLFIFYLFFKLACQWKKL